MIRSFKDRETPKVAAGQRSRALPPDIQQRAFVLLKLMDDTDHWNELRNPPSNNPSSVAS